MFNDDGISMDSLSGQSEGDLIKVGELTQYEISVWRFPDTMSCPMRSCPMAFSTRDSAIKHYKDAHAKHSALCKICNVPLMLMSGAHHLGTHYARKHPYEIVPPKVKNIQPQCSLCGIVYKSYQSLNGHLKTVHDIHEYNHLVPQIQQLPSTEKPLSNTENSIENMEHPGANSPSWEDLDTDNSSVILASLDGDSKSMADNSLLVANSHKQSSIKRAFRRGEDITKLVTRKSRLFNPRHRSHSCTICGISLKNYVLACTHYRQKHGRTVSMCPFCRRYFANSTAFIQHMIEYHPQIRNSSRKVTKVNVKPSPPKLKLDVVQVDVITNNSEKAAVSSQRMDVPEGVPPKARVEVKITKSTPKAVKIAKKNNAAENGVDVENDIILLGECTEYQTMLWRFPNIKICPRLRCRQRFSSRANAIQHYRTKHAKSDLLCLECNTIISVSGSQNMNNHYKRIHPNRIPPPKITNHLVNLSTSQMTMASKKTSAKPEQVSPLQMKPTIKPNGILKRHLRNKPEQTTEESLNSVRIVQCAQLIAKSKTVNIAPEPSVISMIDLSQDDDSFLGLGQKQDTSNVSITSNTSDASNTSIASAPLATHAIETNRKETNLTEQSNPAPIADEPSRPLQSKRQRTRSTGVRHKACTICGKGLLNYVDACDHYQRSHGRNVLMCPYCELYFLQSALLTKHVLAEHSKDEVGVEVVNKNTECVRNSNADVSNNESVNREDNFVPDLMVDSSPEQTQPQQLMTNPTDNVISNDTTSKCNDFTMTPTVDEPLNLSMKTTSFSESNIIDLTNCALDLSIKSTNK